MRSVFWGQLSKYRIGLLLFVLALSGGLKACHGDNVPHHAQQDIDAALADLIVSDDIAYLAQLGLMRGHLYAGMALFDAGEQAQAATHMKHPDSELYAELVPGMQQRGATQFADSLQALAVAVESRASNNDVDTLYQALERNIAQAEAVVGELNASRIAAVMRRLLDPVAEEYQLAVSAQGRMLNVHEYQDALGFVQVINTYAALLSETSDDASRLQGLNTQLAFLDAAFQGFMPVRNASLTPPATINQIVNQLHLTLSGF